MTRAQGRAARGLLGWSRKDLARKAGISTQTVRRFEDGANVVHSSVEKMTAVFEAGGIEFFGSDAVGFNGSHDM